MPVLYDPSAAPAPAAPLPFPAKALLWTGANGITIPLSDHDAGYACLQGRAGLGPVDPELIADTMWDGSLLVRTHRPSQRIMTIPLLVDGQGDPDAYLAYWRAFCSTLRHPADPDSGLPVPGLLTVMLADGSSRSIPAHYYAGGAPTEDTLDDVGAAWCMLPNLQFASPIATWAGESLGQTWVLSGGGGAGVPPLPPVKLTTATVFGPTTVTNPGDADAYPVWVITGPGTPVITREDTGESYTFSVPVSAGQTVTVDCRPPALAPATALTAVDETGADWWPNLVNYPDFWVLPPGDTPISITMTGATAASSVALDEATEARWLGGW